MLSWRSGLRGLGAGSARVPRPALRRAVLVASPSQLLAADKSTCVLHGCGSLRGGQLAAQRSSQLSDADGLPDGAPAWARVLFTAVQDTRADAKKAASAAASAERETVKTRNMQGLVLEVAMRSIYAGLGVRGASIVLQSLDDVLQFLLPGPVLYKAATDEEFFRAMRAEILGSLLDKDTGFLNAVIVLLKGEGMHQEAEEVQAILSSGMGIEAASDGLHAVRRCLQAVESHAKDKGLGDDIKAMYDYCRAGSPQERATRLEETLFVRCVAATLRGSYTGVLEVDAGAGIGCEVDEGTCTLRLRAGETKYSAAEMDAADVQLQALFLVMAFTLDKVLAAVAAAPAASKARAELVQLPRHFVMDGYCVYAGKATEQQLQRRKAANDRCTVAEHSAINKKGLEHALLQVHFANARFVKL